ncbi:MAG: hypothetical protein JJT89_05945 [Nitriliruptoraceae bacterium]|nr:hypothetical protein [Nitriliruptoraceae bacterium]
MFEGMSDRDRRAAERALVGGPLLVTACVVGFVGRATDRPELFALAMIVTVFALALSIVLFDAPQALVPPHLRAGGGWLAMTLAEHEDDDR